MSQKILSGIYKWRYVEEGYVSMRYRIDVEYEKNSNILNSIIGFFERKLLSSLTKDGGLRLKRLDFVIYDNNNLIVGAEIKTIKESSVSASSLYSYHAKTTKRIQPDSTHKGIEKLPFWHI